MPEGDTIFRAARHLRRALIDRAITAVDAPVLPDRGLALLRRTVRDVESRGKNLLFRFDDHLVLYTHMKMSGSWHIYRPGEPWRKPRRSAVVRLDNEAFVVVCFSAPVVELMTEARARRHPTLSTLGPDLLAHRPDFDEMARRLRSQGDRPLGEALLDQRALAGVGNVYKSEICFLLGLDPFRPVSDLSDETLHHLLRQARLLMMSNLDTARRTTRHAIDRGRHWVYGRSQAACHRCGTEIRLRRQGDAGRSTYFCPRCQRVKGRAAHTPNRGRSPGRPAR